jgi:hypothetical protein
MRRRAFVEHPMRKLLLLAGLLVPLAGCYSPTYDRYGYEDGYYAGTYGRVALDRDRYRYRDYDRDDFGYAPKSGYSGPDVNPD